MRYIDDDWDKLSKGQRDKIEKIKCNNWEQIEVYFGSTKCLKPFANKDSTALILIYKVNGQQCRSIISGQVGRKRNMNGY